MDFLLCSCIDFVSVKEKAFNPVCWQSNLGIIPAVLITRCHVSSHFMSDVWPVFVLDVRITQILARLSSRLFLYWLLTACCF